MQDIFVANKNLEKETPIHEKEISETKQLSHARLLSSFCTNPHDINFQNQEKDEKIVLFLRRHFITNLPWMFIAVLLAVIPAIFFLFFPSIDLGILFLSPSLITIFTLAYYLAIFSYILGNFMTWFYNIFIVTAKRVVDIDYSHTIIHNVAETRITHVQDVNYTQAGFISSIFNYGSLFLQTAGSEVNFEALSIPNPRKAVEIITDLIGGKK